jgi:hypothetical protein
MVTDSGERHIHSQFLSKLPRLIDALSPSAKPLDFLNRHNVWVFVRNDFGDSLQVYFPVRTTTMMNVVCQNAKLEQMATFRLQERSPI